MLSEPEATRYDLRFSIADIPVRVHPAFWVMAVVFGASAGSLVRLIVWVAGVFLSILVHELGHVLMMRAFRQRARIFLSYGGGVSTPEPLWPGSGAVYLALRPGQQVWISLAGSGAGFLLAALILAGAKLAGGVILWTTLWLILPYPVVLLPSAGDVVNIIVTTLVWINIFWGLLNLLPVIPLDGGHIAEIILTRQDPVRGAKRSRTVSWIAAGIVALFGLVAVQSPYLFIFFGYLAVVNYQAVRMPYRY
jgi:Zn-dependent protease